MTVRLPSDDAAAICLDRVALEAGSRLQQAIVRAAPRDSALGWKSASVHPLQPLETEYQGIVRTAVRGIEDPDRRKTAEGAALADFFFFDAGEPRLLGVRPGEGYGGREFPLSTDRLAEVRRQLGRAAAVLAPPSNEAPDGPTLRRALQAAYDGIVALLQSCHALPGSRGWAVPPVAEAERQLTGAPQHIETVSSVADAEQILAQLRASADALEMALDGVGTVQMFYVIEGFALFRLLVRYRIDAEDAISSEAARAASSVLTGLVANGHPWLSVWLRDKMAELAARIARADPSGNTLFFLKGGRALAYLEGQPAQGKNDWDTQIVINPTLPAAEWYDLFLRIANEVLLALEDFKLQFYMLLSRHAGDFNRELDAVAMRMDVEPPEPTPRHDALSDPMDIEDWTDPMDVDDPVPAAAGAKRANCKAELIDVGLPRYDSVEAHEQWHKLSAPGAILVADGVPYPGSLYYIDEYVQMLREVFAGDSPSPDKAASRIERLYKILQLPGSAAVVAAQRAAIPPALVPQSIALVDQVDDAPTRFAHTVLLRQFAEAYGLAADPGLAGYFDRHYAGTFNDFFVTVPPARRIDYPEALRQAIDALIAAGAWPPAYTRLGDSIGFAQIISNVMKAHFEERGKFMEAKAQKALIEPVLDRIDALFPPDKEYELQLAGGGAYAAKLHAGYAFFRRPDELDPLAFIALGLYSPNPQAKAATMLEPVKGALVPCSGAFTLVQDTPSSPLRLFWATPDAIASFGYGPLALEISAEPPPQRPLLSFVWGNPLLSLRGLIAQYRAAAAEIEEYGRRAVLLRTARALIEILTSAENPEPANPALVALRDDRCRHLMIASDSNAVGPGARYPAGYYPDMAFEVTLTANREALRRQLRFGGPRGERTLDLLVVNRGHGEIGGFAGWSAQELSDNLVEPLIASGVRAHLIVLDFCVSASLLQTFAPLVVPGGQILASLYSISEVVLTTELWTEIQPALQRRSIPDIGKEIMARASRISRSLTGSVHLEDVRQGASEEQIADHLRIHPDDRDPISIIRYLPRIAEVIAGAQGSDTEAAHRALLAVKQHANLGFAEQAVLGPVPGLGTPFTPAMRSEIAFAFRNRVVAILTSPAYGLGLPVAGLPPFGTGISLWSRLRDHREELLALAKGLPRCPSPFAVWNKRNLALELDSALAEPHLNPSTSRLISQVEPQAPADVQTIRHQLMKSGTAAVLIPIKHYLQQIDTPPNVLQILSPAPVGQW